MWYVYLNWFILGQFKWVLAGSFLTILALAFSTLLNRWIKPRWLQELIAVVVLCLFLWYGHELVDPTLHRIEFFWQMPIDEKMIIAK